MNNLAKFGDGTHKHILSHTIPTETSTSISHMLWSILMLHPKILPMFSQSEKKNNNTNGKNKSGKLRAFLFDALSWRARACVCCERLENLIKRSLNFAKFFKLFHTPTTTANLFSLLMILRFHSSSKRLWFIYEHFSIWFCLLFWL